MATSISFVNSSSARETAQSKITSGGLNYELIINKFNSFINPASTAGDF